MTAHEVVKFAKENSCEMVDLQVPRFRRHLAAFSTPMSEFSEEIFEEGVGFDGLLDPRWQPIHNSDMLIVRTRPRPRSTRSFADEDPFFFPTLKRQGVQPQASPFIEEVLLLQGDPLRPLSHGDDEDISGSIRCRPSVELRIKPDSSKYARAAGTLYLF